MSKKVKLVAAGVATTLALGVGAYFVIAHVWPSCGPETVDV